MVPHRGARGRAISTYSTPWPLYVFWSLPIVVHHWGCALLAVTEEAAIHDAPGAYTCTCYSTHSPALFAKRIVLVKRLEGRQLPRYGQQPPAAKGLQPAPIRRQDMRLDMAVFAWNLWCTNKLHTTDVHKMQCFWRRIAEIHNGFSRGPQTVWPS